MSGWRTKSHAESIGMSVNGFLKTQLESGLSYADIGRKVGASRHAIRRLALRHGLSRKPADEKRLREELGELNARDLSSDDPKLPEVLALLYSGDCELARHKLRVLVREYAALCADSRMRRAA